MEKPGSKKNRIVKNMYEQDSHLKLEKCHFICNFALISIRKRKSL